MNSTMERADFFQVLREGGTVTYKGSLIKSVADIPSEAELAQGDPAAELEAKQNILAEMDRLKNELAILRSAESKVEKEETVKGRKADASSDAAVVKS